MNKIARFAVVLSLLVTVAGCITVSEEQYMVQQRKDTVTVKSTYNCHELLVDRDAADGSTRALDSSGFRLMTWNILKGWKEGWQADFESMIQDRDLLILQEAYLSNELLDSLESRSYNWDLAAAFEYKDKEAGVLTASKIVPRGTCALRADEPLIQLPKTILISSYPLTGTDNTLLVANIHSINFTLAASDFQVQLEALIQAVERHQGPMVVGGDFNTWSAVRMAIVENIAHRLGLHSLKFDSNNRAHFWGRQVDHIFYRDLQPLEANVPKVTTSDHNPMLVTFRYDTNG
jgi:endonuclease/exonuclease/phosphatase (EEP) superfamily protein YafD